MLTPSPLQNNAAVKFGMCSTAEQWEESDSGIKLKGTDSCWHPLGGLSNPAEDTQLVIYEGGCSEDKASFEVRVLALFKDIISFSNKVS